MEQQKKYQVDLYIGLLDPDDFMQHFTIKEAVDKLHKEAYHIMQVMNGINPGDATYNVDQNIDNYVKTM